MKRIIALATTLFCSTLLINAQELEYAASTKLHTITDSQAKYSAVYILKERLVEYKKNNKSGDLDQWVSEHFIVKVNNDKGIEQFNTFTFVQSTNEGFAVLKARSIQPNGKLIDVPADKIKSQKAENGRDLKLIAIEGLEKGSELEVVTKQKIDFDYFGFAEFQSSIPVLEAAFTLRAPEHIIFETKGYNGFPTATSTTSAGITTHIARNTNIEPLETEEYGFRDAALQRIDYKVSYVADKPGQRLHTWDELSRILYNRYYQFTPEERKAIDAFIVDNGLQDKGITDEEVITKTEEAIKSKIVLNTERDDDNLSKITKIVKDKVADKSGFLKLFCIIFDELNVSYELGMSASKNDVTIDKDFENWKYMNDYYIYFPGHKKFISPTDLDLRYPFASSSCVGNYGIFCKILSVGGTKNAKSQLRKITTMPMEYNNNNLDAEVTFAGTGLVPTIKATHALTGHDAEGVRSAFVQLPDDKKRELVKTIIQYANTLEDIKTYNVTNTAMVNFNTNKPLEITTTTEAKELNGKAGNKFLFKVGSIIGVQNEMYKQETKRLLPIEILFPQAYHRTITVVLPDGYTVSNPESVVINKDRQTYGFVSNYKQEGNKFTITILEYYKELSHPATEIDNYREVINAAADFNKVVLVLQKL
jgi:hypothetical protein